MELKSRVLFNCLENHILVRGKLRVCQGIFLLKILNDPCECVPSPFHPQPPTPLPLELQLQIHGPFLSLLQGLELSTISQISMILKSTFRKNKTCLRKKKLGNKKTKDTGFTSTENTRAQLERVHAWLPPVSVANCERSFTQRQAVTLAGLHER